MQIVDINYGEKIPRATNSIPDDSATMQIVDRYYGKTIPRATNTIPDDFATISHTLSSC
jgi:hypothetical protein